MHCHTAAFFLIRCGVALESAAPNIPCHMMIVVFSMFGMEKGFYWAEALTKIHQVP